MRTHNYPWIHHYGVLTKPRRCSAVWRLVLGNYHHFGKLLPLKLSQTSTEVDLGHCYPLLPVVHQICTPFTLPRYCAFRLTFNQTLLLKFFTNSVGVNYLGFIARSAVTTSWLLPYFLLVVLPNNKQWESTLATTS